MSQCSKPSDAATRETLPPLWRDRHFIPILRVSLVVIVIGVICAVGVHGHPFIAIWLGLALLGWLFLAGAKKLSH